MQVSYQTINTTKNSTSISSPPLPFKKKLNKYSFDFSIYVFFFDKRLQTHGSIFDKLILGGRKIILDETTPLQILSITQINSKVRYFILESFHKLVYFLSGKFHPFARLQHFKLICIPQKARKNTSPVSKTCS